MRSPRNDMPLAGGFTLIELLVAVVVAALLAGIAYPSYVETVRKSKRMEGRAALMRLMQQQELFYSRHNSYISFSSSSSDEEEKKFKWFSAHDAKSSVYEIKGEACQGETIQNCVLLTAMPGTGKVDANFKDPTCGELSLSSGGLKSAVGPDCWK